MPSLCGIDQIDAGSSDAQALSRVGTLLLPKMPLPALLVGLVPDLR